MSSYWFVSKHNEVKTAATGGRVLPGYCVNTVYKCIRLSRDEHEALCVFCVQVKRSYGLCSLQLTYFDEENEEVRDSCLSSLWSYLLIPHFFIICFPVILKGYSSSLVLHFYIKFPYL